MTDTHPIPDEALDEDIAILGRKGGGKSYTAKGIVERLLDMGRRVLVLDPLGVWAGLRTSADGEKAGYPVAIFGGLHGDLPLDPAAAEPLASIIARENLPAVVDLSELSKSAQQAFLLKFLHELRRANHDALTVVLEEADVFAPQNPQGDDSKALHGEIDWIARRGRFKGFRLLTITQRPARLSKDVLTQANMVIMHRLPAPQDRDAAKAWVDGNGDRDQAKVVFDTLAGLKVGEAWVLAQEPAMLKRATFPRIRTLDTSATPKAGETRIVPKTLAEVDVSAIREALATAAPATTKAAKNIPQNITAELTSAEERGYQRGLADWRVGFDRELRDALAGAAKQMEEAVTRLRDAIGASQTAVSIQMTQVSSEPRKAVQQPPAARREASSGPNSGHVRAGTALLAAISRYPHGITWSDAAIVAGLMSGNGYFYGGKKYLLTEGLVHENGDIVVAFNREGDPATLDEIVARWSVKLKKPGDLMLERVAAVGSIAPAALAAELNIKTGNGYWYGGLKAMRAAGLTVDDKNLISLSPLLASARPIPGA